MSNLIGVLIGMALFYFLLSVIVSALKEGIAAKMEWRSEFLERGIKSMLANDSKDASGKSLLQDLADEIFKHPLVQALSEGDKPKPSYMPSRTFSVALEDVLAVKTSGTTDFAELITKLPDGSLKRRLTSVIRGVEHDAEECRKAVDQWFDDTMDRVSGWYKRHAQTVMFALGCVLVIFVNADTLRVGRELWTNTNLRDPMAATAKNTTAGTNQTTAEKELLNYPIGWTQAEVKEVRDAYAYPTREAVKLAIVAIAIKLFGWALTALAISLGAPFWFDLMNKFVNLRAAGAPPDTARPPDRSTPVVTTMQLPPIVLKR
jgi:hypothetical protein